MSTSPAEHLPPAAVFLSYARMVSAEAARAVRDVLLARGVSVFLDESDIEHGERFPERIVDALLGATVVVVFADAAYFTRWYCLWEWRVARTPFLTVCERRGSTEQMKAVALAGLVLALPPAGQPPALDRFPAMLRETHWPRAADAAAVADIVGRHLADTHDTLADRLDTLPETGGAGMVREQMLGVVRLPPPRSLKGIPRAPLVLPQSISEHFVGRADDLWRIDDLLVTRVGGTPGAAALTGALTAMGGVGKTRLALEYLHRFGPEHFSGGLFWIDADQDASQMEVRHHEIITELNRSCGKPTLALLDYGKPGSGANLQSDLVHAVESIPEGRFALVVLDNVPEPEASSAEPPPLETWWPARGLTAVLATSRFDVSLAEGGSVSSLPLDSLDAASAGLMLIDSYDGRGRLSESDWSRVTAWIGYLPLGLTLLNGALRSGGLEPEALLAQAVTAASVTKSADEALQMLRGASRTDGKAATYRGISAALGISYDRLTSEQRDAACLLAAFASAPIPIAVLDALGEKFSSSTRAALTMRRFVTPLPAVEPPMFGVMHRVLADFLRARTDRPRTAAQCVTIVRDALLTVLTPDRYRDPNERPLVTACLPHAEALLPSDVDTGPELVARVEEMREIVDLALTIPSALHSEHRSHSEP